MRRSTAGALGLFVATTFGLQTSLHAYTQAEDLILLQRDPFTTQASLDSDYRLQGMGGLDLPIDDESNKVGTFKYGNAPAGLAQDYPQSKAELGFWAEGGTLKDKESNDTAFTGDVADVGQAVLHGMVALRTGHTEESHGAFAAGFIGEGSNLEYTGSYKNDNGLSKLESNPGVGQFNIGYGHQLGHFLFGVGLNSVGATPVDVKSTDLGGNNLDFKDELSITEFVPSVGYVAPLANSAVSFTLSPRFQNQEEKIKIPGLGVDQKVKQDGTLFDIGAHYGSGKSLQSALYITEGGIDGDVTTNGAKAGTSNTDTNAVRFRLYGRPTGSRFSFGVLWENLNTQTEVKNQSGIKTSDDETTDKAIGGGVAYHFSEDKGLIGIELRLLNDKFQDHVTSNSDEKTKGVEVRLGGEHIVGSKLWLRAGFNVKSLDVDPDGGPTLNATVSQLTAGGEYNFNQRASLALNLSSVGIVSEGSSSAAIDKESYGGGSIQLVGKIHFGETAAQ